MNKGLLFAALLVPMMALAEPPTTADDWYKEGETQYNLGNFESAADAFKKGYEVEPDEAKKPAYLYNVAQAYRLGNKCKEASFFYKRFLALKERDSKKPIRPALKAEVEKLQDAGLVGIAKQPDISVANGIDGQVADHMAAPKQRSHKWIGLATDRFEIRNRARVDICAQAIAAVQIVLHVL